jgi:hypothetical protein
VHGKQSAGPRLESGRGRAKSSRPRGDGAATRLWMCGMTPPPAIVALMSVSSSSSPRMASCRWRGVMRLTLRSLAALPASSSTSAVRYLRARGKEEDGGMKERAMRAEAKAKVLRGKQTLGESGARGGGEAASVRAPGAGRRGAGCCAPGAGRAVGCGDVRARAHARSLEDGARVDGGRGADALLRGDARLEEAVDAANGELQVGAARARLRRLLGGRRLAALAALAALCRGRRGAEGGREVRGRRRRLRRAREARLERGTRRSAARGGAEGGARARQGTARGALRRGGELTAAADALAALARLKVTIEGEQVRYQANCRGSRREVRGYGAFNSPS